MDQKIEQLVELQRMDLELARIAARLKALPSELAQAESALTAAQRNSSGLAAKLEQEETLRGGYEQAIAGHRQKAARFRKQLDVVTTAAQAEALEHEIGFAEQEIARIEDEELAGMERSETLDASLAAASKQVEAQTLILERARGRGAEETATLRQEAARLKAQRLELRAAMDAGLLAGFDRVAASRGTGLARAEAAQCAGCRMGIRPQMWNQLRDGLLLPCESCSRLLYYDPAVFMTAAGPVGPADRIGGQSGAPATTPRMPVRDFDATMGQASIPASSKTGTGC